MALLGLAIVAGIFTSADYGVAWDSNAQRLTGRLNAFYIGGSSDELLTYQDRDYGPVFELMLYPFEDLGDTSRILPARHLASHLFFLVCCGAFYCLLFLHFRDRWLAFAGMVFLILSPRIYGQSHFNSKDVPALDFWVLSLLALRYLIARHSWPALLLAAATFALMANIRLIGLLFIGLVLIYLSVRAVYKLERVPVLLAKCAAFIVTFFAVLYATWPYLWADPLGNFAEAIRNMSKFRWGGEVLYLGGMIRATELPRSYLFVWIACTTPLLYLILALFGVIGQMRDLARRRLAWIPDEQGLAGALILLSLLLPFAAVVLLRPVLYDGWRHFYFVYPSLIFFSVASVAYLRVWLEGQRRLGYAGAGIGVFFVVGMLQWMVYAHPFQHLFFNSILRDSRSPLWTRMEVDYWGPTVIEGLRYILQNDERPLIRVTGKPDAPLHFNRDMFPPALRDRLQLVKEDEPHDYFVTCYRFVTKPVDAGMEVYRVVLNDSEVMSVFKVHGQ